MDFFIILLIILFATAIIDLVVGVSNDAVNFLNSAIGSKVAPIRTILLVASAGILLGSVFSSGMMEIARNGLFNPSFFSFEQVMYLFLAVMLTDIILLDFYNSLGLPTSTTVSLVFEILGAAFVIGVIHSFTQGLAWQEVPFEKILNFSSAFTIVAGIFLSILLAFVFGSLIQRVSRALFTFSLKKSVKRYGAIFCGLSITTIVYFLLIKGLKGSTLVSDVQVKWVEDNTVAIVIGSSVFFSIVIQLIMRFTRINPMRVVVLLGTFSLAMAFAGNDLVNFIGVALGGWVAFQHWSASGLTAEQYQMGVLAEKLVTPTWILFCAGIIMVITLWTSAKGRRVTETEISLSRQDEGDEKFRPNFIARLLVGTSLLAGRTVDSILPRTWSQTIEKRFRKGNKVLISEKDQPSFDLVRASVNLLVSSVLIAYGTSQKLPLSTTFVTFMVAMGTSFADQAWGRDSAVYRVAGVMNVIMGWLITAIIAFTFSGLIAFIFIKTDFAGVLVITLLAAVLLIRSHVVFLRREKRKASDDQVYSANLDDVRQALAESSRVTVKNLKMFARLYSTSVHAMEYEKSKILEKSSVRMREFRELNEKVQLKIIKYIRKMPGRNLSVSRLYLFIFDHTQDLFQSILLISESCKQHLKNFHGAPSKRYLQQLRDMDMALQNYIDLVCEDIESSQFRHVAEVNSQYQKWLTDIEQNINEQIRALQEGLVGNRIGMLQMQLLVETKDIFSSVRDIYNLYYNHYNESHSGI